jgi:hypothetical protein
MALHGTGMCFGDIDSFSSTNGHQAGASSASSATNAWGLSPVYNNIKLRMILWYTDKIAVYKKLPFYNLLTNVTQSYHIPGTFLLWY